jgi:hypothetical protein
MFVLAKYNMGVYQLTSLAFPSMETAVAFMEQEKMPSVTWVIIDMTFAQVMRKVA